MAIIQTKHYERLVKTTYDVPEDQIKGAIRTLIEQCFETPNPASYATWTFEFYDDEETDKVGCRVTIKETKQEVNDA